MLLSEVRTDIAQTNSDSFKYCERMAPELQEHKGRSSRGSMKKRTRYKNPLSQTKCYSVHPRSKTPSPIFMPFRPQKTACGTTFRSIQPLAACRFHMRCKFMVTERARSNRMPSQNSHRSHWKSIQHPLHHDSAETSRS